MMFAIIFSLWSLALAKVLELDVSNFKSTVLDLPEGHNLFVKFYAPWCGHCKRLAPAWDKLSETFEGTNTTIAHVDASTEENRIIGKYFGVRGFPTLKLFRDQKQFDYKGPRDFESLNTWLAEESFLGQIESALDVSEETFVITTTTTTTVPIENPIVVLNDSNFEHETQASTGATTGTWFVKFFTPWCGHCKRLAPEWQKLANSVDSMSSDLVIAEVDLQMNTDLQTRFGIRGYPSLMLFHKGTLYEYKGARQAEDMLKWYESGAFKKAQTQRPVPPVLTFASKIRLQASEILYEVGKLYSTLFSTESLKVMYHNQPVLVVSGGIIVALTSCLILYQFWSIALGILSGEEKKGSKDE